jgi:hypothetical protein
MHWFNRLEHKFGHLAIPHLIRVITLFNALVFILYKMNPAFLDLLYLDPVRIQQGELWRCFSYIFIPSIGHPLFDWLTAILYIWFLWWIGDGLEQAMGAFRLNVFYLVGMIACTVAAFYTGSGFTAALLNSTLFFAFARYYPDEVIYLMLLIPVKVKWLAWITAAFILLGFLVNGWGYRAAVVTAFANYLLFFGKDILGQAALRAQTTERRKRFESAARPETDALHHCKVCGRTEHVAPELEFRVAADGEEYCVEHLPR